MRGCLAVILTLALYGCSAGEPGDAAAPASTAASAAATTAQVRGRAPAGALVSLDPVGGVPMPEGSALMDQFSKAFVPETLFARVGQPVVFKNSEDQLHNVTVVRMRTGASIFNISQNQATCTRTRSTRRASTTSRATSTPACAGWSW